MANDSAIITSSARWAWTAAGDKHVPGIEIGATEKAAAVKKLLIGLGERGLRIGQQYLFVMDGAKALRAGIAQVFGAGQPVQRCRNRKMRNVVDEVPREQHARVLNVRRAAWKLSDAEEGMKRWRVWRGFWSTNMNRRRAASARAWRRCSRFKD